MLPQIRSRSGLDAGLDAQSPRKKPCLADDLMAAIELQRQLDHPTAAEKELNRRIYNDKHRADEVEIRNMTNAPFLRLPQEIRDMIYEYVFSHRVIRIGWKNGKLRLANGMYTGSFALPSVCRKFRQETTALLYTEVTCQLVTFRFVSLVETWRTAIRLNPADFVDFLRALPASIAHFEVVGVEGGLHEGDMMRMDKFDGAEKQRRQFDRKMAIKLRVRTVFPHASIRFCVVKDLRQL